MKVEPFILECAQLFGDTAYGTVSTNDWIRLYNEAVSAIISLRPDAHTETKTLTLVAGTQQTLTGTGEVRLMRLVCNMVAGVPGQAIRAIAMKDIPSSWHSDAADAGYLIYEYAWSLSTPRDFWVYPQATVTNSKVSAIVATVPADATDYENDDHDLPAIYTSSVIDWMMHRIFSGDDERTPNYIKSRDHRQDFYKHLGFQTKADSALNPKQLDQS